jgi:hypothetical protein
MQLTFCGGAGKASCPCYPAETASIAFPSITSCTSNAAIAGHQKSMLPEFRLCLNRFRSAEAQAHIDYSEILPGLEQTAVEVSL